MSLPTLRGTDHIGFTVPDLNQATDFFVNVIGCELVYSLGPFQREDNWMQDHLRVHPRTVMKELRFFRCGFGTNFEIFEYQAADGQAPQPKNSDIGGHHLAFYVDDLDAAISYLKESGIEILGEPTASQNASSGQRWVYFLSPWGMQLELVSYPLGKKYEVGAKLKLWHPGHPAE
jgi:catechol 2,3-dioxygenase-like lactoylglutathione lyase family enzyme